MTRHFFWHCALLLPIFSESGLSAVRIEDFKASPAQFQPSKGEKTDLTFSSSEPVRADVLIVGPDRRVIRRLPSVRQGTRIMLTIWDGRDSAGRVVPNEAYSFVVDFKAPSGESGQVDANSYSGGEFGDVVNGSVSRRGGTINYKLSNPSRVLMRVGVPGGALLKTIVDWQPRPAGAQTEYWNGLDQDNLVDVVGLKTRSIVTSYMTLPANTIITFGNDSVNYREYSERFGSRYTQLPMPVFSNNRRVSPHFTKDRLRDRGFRLRITFPELDKPGATAIPTVRDRLLVNIEVDPTDREVVANQQLEVILFTDLQFHSEEERGYLPFRYPLEVADLSAGEHVLTVNVVTFGDQVGIGSRKFKVVK